MVSPKLFDCHPLLSDRVRLTVLAALTAAGGEVPFSELLESLNLTKGNLSSHMKKLEEADLIIVSKVFVARKPRTTFKISKQGKRELKSYINSVSALI